MSSEQNKIHSLGKTSRQTKGGLATDKVKDFNCKYADKQDTGKHKTTAKVCKKMHKWKNTYKMEERKKRKIVRYIPAHLRIVCVKPNCIMTKSRVHIWRTYTNNAAGYYSTQ